MRTNIEMKRPFLIFCFIVFSITFTYGEDYPKEVSKTAEKTKQILQKSQDYYLYVYTLDEKLKPDIKNVAMSNNEELNQIFKNFGVIEYAQSFPGAKNPDLYNYYEIHFEGDVDSLENLLRGKNIFERIYRSDYYKPAVCNNAFTPNDPFRDHNGASLSRAALDTIRAQCAWGITKGDANIIVGVVDTRFDTAHIDMKNTFRSYNVIVMERTQHGTQVASCIAADANNNTGIAAIGYNTKIKGYVTGGLALWRAITTARGEGRKIINVSWTGIGSYPNIEAVRDLVNSGVVLVVAAGNSDTSTFHSLYADIPGVINVSGIDQNGNYYPGFARNKWVDICAPSRDVTVCDTGSRYGTNSGTSFAAPMVSGTVALMFSVNASLSPANVERIIKATALPIANEHPLYSGLVGAGRLDAYHAVKMAASCASSTPVTFSKTVTASEKVNEGSVNIINTTVTSGNKLTVNACNSITITGNFTVERGASLDITVFSP